MKIDIKIKYMIATMIIGFTILFALFIFNVNVKEGDKNIEKIIPFKTIAKGEHFEKNDAEPWRSMEFLIFANSATWNNFLDEHCRDDLKKNLKNFSNFNEYFLLVALQGSQPTDGYSINITNIVQRGKTVDIRVHLVKPSFGIDVVTSPYHIIKK